MIPYQNQYSQPFQYPYAGASQMMQNYQAQNSMFGQQQQMQTPAQSQQQAQNVTWIPVSGVQGAKDHIVQPNNTAWLMDNNDTVFYVKTSDNLGVTTLKAYRFTEINLEAPAVPQPVIDTSQYVQRGEFEQLKEQIEQLTTQKKQPIKANKEADNG